MYRVLTANTPGCVAFSCPVQRWNLKISGVPAFSVPPLRAKRDSRGRRERVGSKPERRPVPGTFQGRFWEATTPISDSYRSPQVISGERSGRQHLGLQRRQI